MKNLLRAVLPIDKFNKRDRLVAFLMWTVGVVQGFSQSHASATLPYTRQGLGISEAEMSAVLAFTRLASLGAFAFAWFADRKGRKRPFLWSLALLCLAAGSTSAVANPAQYTAAQGLVRAATSAITALAVVLLAEHLRPLVRAYGVSIYGAAGSFGAGMGLMTLPLAEINFRIPFAISLAGLLILPLLARNLEESYSHPQEVGVERSRLLSLLHRPHRRLFWTAASASLLIASFLSVGLAFTTERLVSDIGFTAGQAVLISLAGGTMGAVGFFVGGRWSDLWGRRPTTIMALFAALGGGLLLYWLEQPQVLVPAIVLSSFGAFAMVPAAGIHRAELFPTPLRATAATAIAYVGTLGSAAGLFVGRFTIDRIGLSQTVTLLGGGMLVAIVLTMFLPETRGRDLVAF